MTDVPPTTPRLTGDDFATAFRRLVTAISAVVVGQERVVEELIVAALARGHVLLEGVPGLGKTKLVRTFADACALEYNRIQFTPDLMPADVTGTNVFIEARHESRFEFQPGPVFTNVLLADEINRATPKTQSALLEAMQERAVTVDGETRLLSPGFTVFATQNPIEFEGTYPLPEAELDRFLVKVLLRYPSDQAEQGMLGRVLGGFDAAIPASFGIGQVLDSSGLEALRTAARRVRVEPSIVAYITALVRVTRETPTLTLGASPRASVALLLLAQASALLDGRDFVVPDDVKSLAPPVLRHRVQVAPELELEGVTPDAAVQALFERVEAPRA